MDFTLDTYPDEVKDYVLNLYQALVDSAFFSENEIEKNGKAAFEYIAAPQIMKRWLNGDIDSIIDEDDTLDLMLKQTIALSVFFNIKDKGLIGMMDDEDGNDFFYLTSAGKEFKQNINASFDQL
jgi:hypothetical protein